MICLKRACNMTRKERKQSVSDRQLEGTWWCVGEPSIYTLLLVGVDVTVRYNLWLVPGKSLEQLMISWSSDAEAGSAARRLTLCCNRTTDYHYTENRLICTHYDDLGIIRSIYTCRC